VAETAWFGIAKHNGKFGLFLEGIAAKLLLVTILLVDK
jgi:hypothetical protein